MRQPPSPLLLSARKRRPRRNPPRGQLTPQLDGSPGSGESSQQAQAASDEKCALLERAPGYSPPVARPDDDDSTTSSR